MIMYLFSVLGCRPTMIGIIWTRPLLESPLINGLVGFHKLLERKIATELDA